MPFMDDPRPHDTSAGGSGNNGESPFAVYQSYEVTGVYGHEMKAGDPIRNRKTVNGTLGLPRLDGHLGRSSLLERTIMHTTKRLPSTPPTRAIATVWVGSEVQ
jgi:hypothetical protein